MHPLLQNKLPNGFNAIIRLFHGTNGKFKRFDIDMAGSNTGYQDADKGFYLTASEPLAECYAVGCVGRSGGDKTILEFCVRIENPVIFKRSTDFYRELDLHKLAGSSLIADLKEKGCDSIIVRDDMEEVIVFDADNILAAESLELVNATEQSKPRISRNTVKSCDESAMSF